MGKISDSAQGHDYGKDSQQRWDGADRSERRTMIGDELRSIEEEIRMAGTVAIKTKGAWRNCEDEVSRNISWNMHKKMKPLRVQFLIRATYNQLPTPTNLLKWGMTESKKCSLCDRPCNLEHILSSSRTALTQRRFTWRHNQVLEKLAHQVKTIPGQQSKYRWLRQSNNEMWQIY